MKNTQQGFTLLELLVVILMIGIVATVVIVSLNGARNRGRDTGIAANLANIRPQAESVYVEDGNYNQVCGAGGAEQNETIARIIVTAIMESPAADSIICATPASGPAENWAVSLQLATDGYWCVDSTGFSGQTETGLTSENDLTCK